MSQKLQEQAERLVDAYTNPDEDLDPADALRCLRWALQERETLQQNLAAVQRRCSELLEQARASDRRAHVQAFFRIANQTARETPGVPSEAELRLGLSLIVEEGILELLPAALDIDTEYDHDWVLVRDLLHRFIERAPARVRLVPLMDATIDIDYVVEGLRVRCGVGGAQLWTEVHAKNMAKQGGPKDPVTGKQLKPDGWTPPDIDRLLREQGWEGDVEQPSRGWRSCRESGACNCRWSGA